MPLVNIVDGRKRKFRHQKINAIVEAAWHDNSCKDSDQVKKEPALGDGPNYEEKEHITLEAAVAWASSFPQKVTLFLYDEDRGIYVTKRVKMAAKREFRFVSKSGKYSTAWKVLTSDQGITVQAAKLTGPQRKKLGPGFSLEVR